MFGDDLRDDKMFLAVVASGRPEWVHAYLAGRGLAILVFVGLLLLGGCIGIVNSLVEKTQGRDRGTSSQRESLEKWRLPPPEVDQKPFEQESPAVERSDAELQQRLDEFREQSRKALQKFPKRFKQENESEWAGEK